MKKFLISLLSGAMILSGCASKKSDSEMNSTQEEAKEEVMIYMPEEETYTTYTKLEPIEISEAEAELADFVIDQNVDQVVLVEEMDEKSLKESNTEYSKYVLAAVGTVFVIGGIAFCVVHPEVVMTLGTAIQNCISGISVEQATQYVSIGTTVGLKVYEIYQQNGDVVEAALTGVSEWAKCIQSKVSK